MNDSTSSKPHADGHHHNGSAVADPSSKSANGHTQGTISDLAAMATGLATKVEELARLAKDLAQNAGGRVQDPAHEVGGGGQKAKQGASSNNDLQTSAEHKGPGKNS
jgi:hypothetical protein